MRKSDHNRLVSYILSVVLVAGMIIVASRSHQIEQASKASQSKLRTDIRSLERELYSNRVETRRLLLRFDQLSGDIATLEERDQSYRIAERILSSQPSIATQSRIDQRDNVRSEYLHTDTISRSLLPSLVGRKLPSAPAIHDGSNTTTRRPYTTIYSHPFTAENGSYYGQLNQNGVPKTVRVRGYFRRDGTYVRGHYRSAPGTNP